MIKLQNNYIIFPTIYARMSTKVIGHEFSVSDSSHFVVINSSVLVVLLIRVIVPLSKVSLILWVLVSHVTKIEIRLITTKDSYESNFKI